MEALTACTGAAANRSGQGLDTSVGQGRGWSRDEYALEAALARPQQKHHVEPEVVQAMTALTCRSLTEGALATWIRARLVRLRL
ncbi:MAG: hypothetical protein LCH84_06540 [Gemmatimonadetes bacterium]|nr:hypothetical protein [Gemmatimonadota bacterium]